MVIRTELCNTGIGTEEEQEEKKRKRRENKAEKFQQEIPIAGTSRSGGNHGPVRGRGSELICAIHWILFLWVSGFDIKHLSIKFKFMIIEW